MRRLVSVAFVLVVCVAAVVLAGAKNDSGGGARTYRIVFDNAFGLTKGGDFRVGGVKAGRTTDFKATSGPTPKAEVTAEITEVGFQDFRSDASCEIRPQSLIGEYYVDCQPGSAPVKLKNDAVIPVTQTTSTVPLDLVNDVMRAPYKERLRLIIDELGTGLAGRPQDLAAVVRRAHPGLRETSQTLRILGRQNLIIENFLRDADTVVTQLEHRKRDVTRFISETGRTAQIAATRRADLRRGFEKLPGFLDELKPTMSRLGELSDEQVPLLIDLQKSGPSLNQFVTKLGPFSDAARPALSSLGDTAQVGTKSFRRGKDEVAELRQLAIDTPGAIKPARQLLASLDDDRRASDADKRALVDGPPASDRSNRNGGKGGFTGFESIWNYFFWQSQSINGFDQVGHILRIGLDVSTCSAYENRTPEKYPNDAALKAKIKQCNAYLGPNQPGITTPDFSSDGQASTLRAKSRQPATKVGERRSAGQPDAAPVAGQPDISKPQVTVPPALKKLLQDVTKDAPKAPKIPNVPTPKVPDIPLSQLPKDLTKKQLDKVQKLLQQGVPTDPNGLPDTGQLLDFLLAP